MKDWLSAAEWAASDMRLELGDRPRWFLVGENHGYAAGRVEAIARRVREPRPVYRRIEDVPVQMGLKL